MAKTNKQRIREVRQEELRAKLASQGHIQYYVENLKKMDKLDPENKTFSNELNKLKVINEQRLKLIDKYLPHLKQQEIELNGQMDFAVVSDECSEEDWNDEYGEDGDY